MLSEIADAIQSVWLGLEQIPRVVLAAAFLATPTLLWLGYRLYVVMPRQREAAAGAHELYWLCRACHSANEFGEPVCYRCGRPPADDSEPLHVIDHGSVVLLPPDEGAATPVVLTAVPSFEARLEGAYDQDLVAGPSLLVGALRPEELPPVAETVQARQRPFPGARPRKAVAIPIAPQPRVPVFDRVQLPPGTPSVAVPRVAVVAGGMGLDAALDVAAHGQGETLDDAVGVAAPTEAAMVRSAASSKSTASRKPGTTAKNGSTAKTGTAAKTGSTAKNGTSAKGGASAKSGTSTKRSTSAKSSGSSRAVGSGKSGTTAASDGSGDHTTRPRGTSTRYGAS